MVDGDVAIRVENLGKRYRIGRREPYKTLRDSLAGAVRAPFRRLSGGSNGDGGRGELIWALRDVSFEVRRGEVVGVIGRNGAGKSTLLKILSRITAPTEGSAVINGRVGSLLEVGTGFHPELTGRENIYLSGAILGMRKREINEKFDEIVKFAEVEKFIDTPLKRYSSGMQVRLAFAVAAHLEPEILLVDEVLAVGDAAFQKKCLGKMGDISKEGRTVLFVSHNMGAIEQLCDKCILLENGVIKQIGTTSTVISIYLRDLHSHLKSSFLAFPNGDKNGSLIEAEILNSNKKHTDSVLFGEPFYIRMKFVHKSRLPGISYSIRIYDQKERLVSAANTLKDELDIEKKGVIDIFCFLPGNFFIPGEYRVAIGCYIRPSSIIDEVNDCLKLIINNTPHSKDFTFTLVGDPAVAIPSKWSKGI